MNILVADHSGFCFGVKKAVSTAYDAQNESGNIYTYGPIIHNSKVVSELEKKGIKQLSSIDNLKENDTVIIRSHGVSKDIIESLKNKNVNIIDATCPYVYNIHKKVEEYYNKGYQIFIIGDPEHPEVQGINGWCNNTAHIINAEEDLDSIKTYVKICVVAQTTINIDKWKDIVGAVLSKAKEIVVFNTICSATEQRQKSAKEIAQKCDAVIVLGGYNSSNTKKLVDICKKYCDRTYHVESVNELNINEFKDVQTLGITAGASTPDSIIKEAIDKMEEVKNTNEKVNEQALVMDDYEKTFVRLHPGDVVKGSVIYVTDNEVSVDIGYKADGIIPKDELSVDENVSPKDILKIGDEIEVLVLKVNDGEGNVLLSKKKVDAEKVWEYIEKAYTDKFSVAVKVTQVVKGGLTSDYKGVRIFIPASQVDVKYVEDLSPLVGKILDVIITGFNMDKKRVVASRRMIIQEEIANKKKAILDKIQEGDVLSGKVSRITDFGAFIDLGGIDGLIHISELSWNRIKHPSEVVKEGDNVEVYVLSVNKETEKISLSLRRTVPEPWSTISDKIHVGDIIEGKVVRLAPFGAFVEVEKGVDGLVHISQISNKRVNKVEDVLKVGDVIKAKVLEINTESKRLSLSIKEAAEDEIKKENEELLKNQNVDEKITIGDMVDNK